MTLVIQNNRGGDLIRRAANKGSASPVRVKSTRSQSLRETNPQDDRFIILSDAKSSWLVVSDLDNTLLTKPSDAAAAGRVIRECRNQGLRTVLASSKTFSEMVQLHKDAGLIASHFIFENGCGIGWPLLDLPADFQIEVALEQDGFGAVLLGSALESAIEILLAQREKDGLNFSLIGELDPKELTRLTGLDTEAGRQASQRLSSVPMLWRDTPENLKELKVKLSGQGLTVVSGGTFLHVSPPCDKYSALMQLLEWQNEGRSSIKVLACGDSENDLSLLRNADLALLFSASNDSPLIPQIQRPMDAMTPVNAHLRKSAPIIIEGAGPSIWRRSVESAMRCHHVWLTP